MVYPELHFKPSVSVLSAEQIEQIHLATLEVLERTGIHAQWLNAGAKQLQERLRKQTRTVMEHQPAPLPPEVLLEMERMAQSWE